MCGALGDLVSFVQFKKREKHPWRSITFSKVAGLKLTLLHWCFSRFLNCTNGTKSRYASHIARDLKVVILTSRDKSLMRHYFITLQIFLTAWQKFISSCSFLL